jgi:uncharacterized membrane protein YbhN (UPF0104 family)
VSRNKIAGIGRWLPGLVISAIAILLLIRFSNWQGVIEVLTLMDLNWFAAAIIFYLLGVVMRTFSWRTLLQNKASYGRVFLTLNEGYLLNNIFPFRLGELGRAVLLSQATGLSAVACDTSFCTWIGCRSNNCQFGNGSGIPGIGFIVLVSSISSKANSEIRSLWRD